MINLGGLLFSFISMLMIWLFFYHEKRKYDLKNTVYYKLFLLFPALFAAASIGEYSEIRQNIIYLILYLFFLNAYSFGNMILKRMMYDLSNKPESVDEFIKIRNFYGSFKISYVLIIVFGGVIIIYMGYLLFRS